MGINREHVIKELD